MYDNILIVMMKIRGNRSKAATPDKAGGLKAAHLAAVKWLSLMTNAEVEGMELGSTELFFKPTRRIDDVDITQGNDGVWKAEYEDGELVRYQSRISMATPGAVALILQAVLPYIIFLSSPVPLRLVIEGGTNVSKSPSIEYVSQVLLPTLSYQLGLPPFQVEVSRRGWSGGRADIGSVVFDIEPLKKDAALTRFTLQSRGDIRKVSVSLIAPDADDRTQMRGYVKEQLANLLPEIEIEYAVDETSGNPQRCYLLLVAETTTDLRFGCDELSPRKARKGRKKDDKAKQEENRVLVSKVVRDLKRELARGGCVDQHMEDQLVIFQALAVGETLVNSETDRPSLHTQTAQWVAEQMLGTVFDAEGGCKGGGVSRVTAFSEEALSDHVNRIAITD